MSMEELANVKGRGWEDIDVSGRTKTSDSGFAPDTALLTPIIALGDGVICALRVGWCELEAI